MSAFDKDVLLSQILGLGEHEAFGGLTAMSVRLPTHLVMKIAALSKTAGVSRNKMFGLLLEVALMEVEEANGDIVIEKEIFDDLVSKCEMGEAK